MVVYVCVSMCTRDTASLVYVKFVCVVCRYVCVRANPIPKVVCVSGWNLFLLTCNTKLTCISSLGLEDQLLGRVIMTEKSELESERTQLIMDVTANRRKMQELEANLLHKLTTIQGSLVEDVSLIQVLNITKATATEVRRKRGFFK